MEIHVGDCRQVLATLPEKSVQCVVTSPPYWGLRDYKVGNAGIGLEKTFDAWLAAMVEVFRGVRRVLRDDGTVWLNIGDAYASGKGSCFNPGGGENSLGKVRKNEGAHPLNRGNVSDLHKQGLKPKDQIGMPWRLAFALQADGWFLRSDIIWHKPNPMPESVTDRPTKSHEYVFLLTKKARYFYDAEAVREKTTPDPRDRQWGETEVTSRHGHESDAEMGMHQTRTQADGWVRMSNPGGRNLRSVWSIPTQSFRAGRTLRPTPSGWWPRA